MFNVIYVQVCLDSVVTIATCYRLDGSGFKTGQRSDFLQLFRPHTEGPLILLYNGYQDSFQG